MRTFYHHFPIQITKIKKKIDFRHPNIRKDLGFCILVKSLQYKGEVRNSKFEKLIELCRLNVRGVYARSCYRQMTNSLKKPQGLVEYALRPAATSAVCALAYELSFQVSLGPTSF